MTDREAYKISVHHPEIRVIDSEVFGLSYLVDGSGKLAIFGEKGKVLLNSKQVDALIKELPDIKSLYLKNKRKNKNSEEDIPFSVEEKIEKKEETEISSRIQYAEKLFEEHNIEYSLKNKNSGHFHCRRKSDDKLFQFYAGTGKIQGISNARGIHAFIKILEG